MEPTWSQLRMSTLGLENVLARVRLEVPHGWTWELLEFDGDRWVTIDSGARRSSVQAAEALCAALLILADARTF